MVGAREEEPCDDPLALSGSVVASNLTAALAAPRGPTRGLPNFRNRGLVEEVDVGN